MACRSDARAVRAGAQLVLLGERQRARSSARPPTLAASGKPAAVQLVAIEVRPLEEIADLPAPGGVVQPRLLLPGKRLDRGVAHQPASSGRRRRSPPRPAPPCRKPIGSLLLLGEMRQERCGAREDRDAPSASPAGIRGRAAPRRSASRRSSAAACPRPRRPAPRSLARQRAAWRPVDARAPSASAMIRSARGSTGLCSGWPKPGTLPPRASCVPIGRDMLAGRSPAAARRRATAPQVSAVPSTTEPAAENARRDRALQRVGIRRVGHARRLRSLGTSPCSAIATSRRSRKKRCRSSARGR